MEQALIEMAKQIAKLQEENDKLKKLVSKPKRKKKIEKVDPEYERNERVKRWIEVQYQKGFDEVLKDKDIQERLTQIKKFKPTFIPINNCRDFRPDSNTNE
ncbi:hypothetical protein [Sphingobacterium sp.]|uniref:hypothetical protein n=1 Tax=Sphingobacterium sp. TaxID=341027 RepID=UPI0028A79E56|nr:hypothetical protein [Sphingobacterium sp.]